MGSAEQGLVWPLRVRLPSCTTANLRSSTPDLRAVFSAFHCPLGSKAKTFPRLIPRNRLKQEILRGDLRLHLFEKPSCTSEDLALGLSGLGLEIDAKRSYHFSAGIMEW